MIKILEYNNIFFYYLIFIMIINILTIYTFTLYRFYYKEKNIFLNYLGEYLNNKLPNQSDKYNSNENEIYILLYYKLKKIYKILLNPIKFRYQVNQFYDIKKNKNYKKYKENLKNIKNNTKILFLYNKILKIIKNKYSNKNPNKLLLQLLCINF
jgi:hypothetical protein